MGRPQLPGNSARKAAEIPHVFTLRLRTQTWNRFAEACGDVPANRVLRRLIERFLAENESSVGGSNAPRD